MVTKSDWIGIAQAENRLELLKTCERDKYFQFISLLNVGEIERLKRDMLFQYGAQRLLETMISDYIILYCKIEVLEHDTAIDYSKTKYNFVHS